MYRPCDKRGAKFVEQFDVIIGHGPGCFDGATAMWAVWRLLDPNYQEQLAKEGGFYNFSETKISPCHRSFIHPNSVEGAIQMQQKGFPVVFVFVQPGTYIPKPLIEGKNVLVLDLDLGSNLMPLVRNAKTVFVCDHHDTSSATIHKYGDELLNRYHHKFSQLVDTSKKECGATLIWRLTHSDVIPSMLEVIRIGDTWQWGDSPELHAKEVLHSLFVRRSFRSFPDIEQLFQSWNENFDTWVKEGSILNLYNTSLAKQAAKQCDIGSVQSKDGKKYTIAYVQSSILVSEIGTSIRKYAENRFKIPIDFCGVWKYVSRKNLIIVSLRDPRSGLKLGRIAKEIVGSTGTGGGHDESASFIISGLHSFSDVIKPIDFN